ncbi:hypothetical protein SPBR_08610 [Sporothrix brasiliensis 5110]|uniref:Uncharacterized protein n=1 Tax=Sporothrix brasiliensis 5110 TaxID=1398154 RepID=A0A0C2F754_9PEZI|nr:uncharacterized protein SPBR_08610 [Sporothrix brasiliensis 5110]KIH86873.1 hypothetical protein SPBR_08610 [Sporothrix brasiliensis 5110]
MATAAVNYPFAAIPGIGRALTEKDLLLSNEMYNGLTPIEKQVRLQGSHDDHINALLAIIKGHGMDSVFGVHSLHCHDRVPEKTIRLEADATGVEGMKWTRATPIIDALLAQDKIHATFYKVEANDLVPFEFGAGPSPLKEREIPAQFIPDMAQYLCEHDLTNLIAIEVGDFTKAPSERPKRTSELEVVWGTIEKLTVVLSYDKMVEGVSNPVPTGWNIQDQDPEESGPGPGEHWNEATKSDGTKTHKVHVDSVEPVTPQLLHTALVDQGFIKVL